MIMPPLFLIVLLMMPAGEGAFINGTVFDSSNHPVKNGQVIVVPGSHPAVATKEDGAFSAGPLTPGEYSVLILHGGFAPWALHHVRVEAGQSATFRAILKPFVGDFPKVMYWKPRQKDLDSFSAALQAFQQSGFCDKNLLKKIFESYRFLWLRTFHRPILMILNRTAEKIEFLYKELDGAGFVFCEPNQGRILTWLPRQIPHLKKLSAIHLSGAVNDSVIDHAGRHSFYFLRTVGRKTGLRSRGRNRYRNRMVQYIFPFPILQIDPNSDCVNIRSGK